MEGRGQAKTQTTRSSLISLPNCVTSIGRGLISNRQFTTEGEPANAILKFADEIGADLIAMGSHGRTGVLRILMGSVSRQVLEHAKCPVLIVRIPDRHMVAAGMLET